MMDTETARKRRVQLTNEGTFYFFVQPFILNVCAYFFFSFCLTLSRGPEGIYWRINAALESDDKWHNTV